MSWSTLRRRYGVTRRRAFDAERWPVVCSLALIVASDYKFRVRADDQSVSGSPDLFVLLEIAVYAAVACFLFLRFRPTSQLRRADWITCSAYAYAAVLVLSALYSPYRSLALVRAVQVVIVLALSRSIARHCARDALHRIAHAFAILVSASVIFGVVVPFPRLPTQPDRFTWLHLHPVDAGQFLAVAVVILTAYAFGHRLARPGPHWPLPAYLVLLAICTAGLIGSNTRGAALGAIVGGLVIAGLRWRGSRRLEIAVALSVALVTVWLAAGSLIESFFVRGENAERLASLNSRTDLWAYALEAFLQRPLYGHGLSASRGLFLDEIGLGGGHNGLVNLLVDAGLLGAAVWLLLLGCIFTGAFALRNQRPEPRLDRMLILALLSGLFANSMFTQGLGAPANVACTWLFLLAAWTSMAGRRGPAPALARQPRQFVSGLPTTTSTEEQEPRWPAEPR
ncbi:O-antigen ligase family protein [Saccharopolyspora phatthalungensis]|uniref:O-antigen ligase n=1 Tax=Saccharopolyspora phatthalungensis TaxID=664693 RepID=A0A840Q7T2_9PSEU|nr:O-antigen ligase family protein [Saccharopolyspora phatthalungensis]MBB5158572.1 O-antigen ligase [Saccharopolyspora phatthalungensis]